MGFFVSPRGENTFGSTESPSCLVCFAESPFRSLKEQEQCRIAPAACLTFSPGDAGSFSPRTHQGTSSPFIGRGSLDGGGEAPDLLETLLAHEGSGSFKTQATLETSARQRCGKGPGREVEEGKKPSAKFTTFQQEFLHSTPQLEERV